ncbi:hypothetical protein ACHAXR_009529 [Thalassiosira sp. AJA248-18]
MPVDHNFKTAYFVIPDGIEHGDELMCSYTACRQAGVKFRYCLHCKVPVAKRNFRNRHRHGVPGGDGANASDEEIESEEEETTTENAAAGHSHSANGEICKHDHAAEGDEQDYAGVKKEHILIIPGAEPAQTTGTTMMKKKKKSGNVRVPCRARGMPMAHNFKTAYFIIPPTIEHGDELLCSFPSCRSAGAKFRYCLHCKVPVAKRNFRNRHKHGNMGGLDKKKSHLKSPPDVGGGAPQGKAKEEETTNLMPKLPEASTEEKPASIPSSETAEGAKPSESQAAELKEAATEATVPAAADGADGSNTVSISSTHDASQVQNWVKLLENKPNPGDKQAMAVWMLNLMNATEGGDGAKGSSSVEEEGSANSSNEGKRQSEGNGEEEDSSSISSGSNQPPKKKFKQEYEAV